MIRIFLGNLGSGKTASAVREILNDGSGKKTYSNVIIKGTDNYVNIKPQHVIKKHFDGKKTVFDLNTSYWEKQPKPLNILWDEVHLTANSRASMSRVNMVLSRFIAMARRITGFDERGYGHLTFVAQKDRTIDVNIRDLASEISYHKSMWVLRCKKCGFKLAVNSEMQQIERCVSCFSWDIVKENLSIIIYRFNSWEKFYRWQVTDEKLYFKKEIILDIHEYFKNYDTMQLSDIWDKYITQ